MVQSPQVAADSRSESTRTPSDWNGLNRDDWPAVVDSTPVSKPASELEVSEGEMK